jgi:DNA-directed RNA polymerase subunit K/omega
MSAVSAGAAEALGQLAGETPGVNRFLVCVVAFLRAKQLGVGARPRVEGDGHKAAHLAVLEVLADTVSWSAAQGAPGAAGELGTLESEAKGA